LALEVRPTLVEKGYAQIDQKWSRDIPGMLPQENLELDPLRLLLTQSATRLLFNTCDKTVITILNFRISGGGGGNSSPPLSVQNCWITRSLLHDLLCAYQYYASLPPNPGG